MSVAPVSVVRLIIVGDMVCSMAMGGGVGGGTGLRRFGGDALFMLRFFSFAALAGIAGMSCLGNCVAPRVVESARWRGPLFREMDLEEFARWAPLLGIDSRDVLLRFDLVLGAFSVAGTAKAGLPCHDCLPPFFAGAIADAEAPKDALLGCLDVRLLVLASLTLASRAVR